LSSSISVTREGEKENTEDGTEEKKKREKAQEKRKTINQQGLPFGLCFHFLHIKSAEQGKKKVQKTSREKEARRLQR
jgi:hypothetical protein